MSFTHTQHTKYQPVVYRVLRDARVQDYTLDPIAARQSGADVEPVHELIDGLDPATHLDVFERPRGQYTPLHQPLKGDAMDMKYWNRPEGGVVVLCVHRLGPRAIQVRYHGFAAPFLFRARH